MILLTNFVFFMAAIMTGAIRKWRGYYETLLYLGLCNLLYNILCENQWTWLYHPEPLISHKATDLLNTFILLPAIALLYLHFFPEHNRRIIPYYLGWITGLSLLEWLWELTGFISYHQGWNMMWSVGFYFVMFFALRLHHKKPGTALGISVFAISFLLLYFRIPFWK